MGINSLLLNFAMYFTLINFTHILRGRGTCHLITENVHKLSGTLKCFSGSPHRPPVCGSNCFHKYVILPRRKHLIYICFSTYLIFYLEIKERQNKFFILTILLQLNLSWNPTMHLSSVYIFHYHYYFLISSVK